MTENHSFGCIEDRIAMGLHDLSKAHLYRKPKEMTEEEVEQWKQEKWALKTNLDDALDLIDAYKKRVVELEKQILVWHDLRVDKNDLPSKMGLGSKEVYVQLDDGVTDFAYYRFDKCSWERSEDEMSLGHSVIAWCKIPFKE